MTVDNKPELTGHVKKVHLICSIILTYKLCFYLFIYLLHFAGKNYIEVREYRSRSICIRFYFVTRCYYDYMETILQDFMEQPVPDVVFVSSCCWDVTR